MAIHHFLFSKCAGRRALMLVFLSLAHSTRLLAQSPDVGFPRIPLVQNFDADNYRAGIQNWDITQDQRGIIYVANNYGLLEFDGNNWDVHQTPVGSRVLSIFIDKDNRIYLGGQNHLGFMYPDDAGSLKFHSLVDLIPAEKRNINNVWKIFRYEENIVFNTGQYTYFYDGHKMLCVPTYDEGRNLFQVRSILFIKTHEKGLMKFDGSEFVEIPGGDQLKAEKIVEILPNYTGGYLIFSSSGEIYTFQNGIISPWANSMAEFFKSSLINTAYILSDNNLAVGTQNDGLVVLLPDGSLKLHMSRRKGLNSNTIYSIFQDRFSNIWLGLSNGISLIDYSSPFSIIDERLGLPGTGYSACLHDDHLYLGTNNGLFYVGKEAGNSPSENLYYKQVEHSSGQVYSVQSIGDLLLMGHHQGGYAVNGSVATRLSGNEGFWKYEQIPGNNQIIGGTYNGLMKIDAGLKSGKSIDGFTESSRTFVFDSPNSVWLSHGFKGLYHLTFNDDYSKVNKTQFYGQDKGFPSNYLIQVHSINQQPVFTAETGIYQYDPVSDQFVHDTKYENALGGNYYINTLASDHLGDVYYMKQNRVGILRKNKFGEFDVDERTFNPINRYILFDDSENINVLDHQNVLIGAKDGFIHYDPTVSKVPIQEVNLLIRRVEYTDSITHVVYAGGMTDSLHVANFNPDTKSVKFRFSAPYFDGFAETEFQFKLVGFDEDWSAWSTKNEKEYTNLSHGTYTFKAKSKTIYHDESKVVSYTFKIEKPWYLSWWAYTIYLLAVAMVFGASMVWLDQKHKGDKKKMALNQKRAILQKDMQIETVSKESEQRITQLRNEKLRAEVDFKNKELASTTMHLLNKNEVMLEIKSRLESLSKSSSPKSEEVKKLIKSIDRNISEDKDWEQFTKHFDQVHGNFLKKLKMEFPNLTPQETKLSAYLRMNLTSKDIAQLLNISVRGVEIGRYRLRKKLALDRETNLVTFLMNV